MLPDRACTSPAVACLNAYEPKVKVLSCNAFCTLQCSLVTFGHYLNRAGCYLGEAASEREAQTRNIDFYACLRGPRLDRLSLERVHRSCPSSYELYCK